MQLDNPLLPDYDFDAHLVAGLTPIERDSELDFIIDRPNGMQGFIINITTRGKGMIFRGEDQFEVGHGDLLLFPPEAAHFYQRHDQEPRWYHRWIYFRPRGFWSELLSWQLSTGGVYLTKNLSEDSVQLIESLFIDVDLASKQDTPFSGELAVNLLEQLLIRCKTLQPENAIRKLDPRIIEVINIMSDNICREYSVEELASRVYLSASRLAHLFREDVGSTIIQWRNDQRINYAKQLLTTSQISINRISRIVGYTDPLYFSRIFKRVIGVSPKAFRNYHVSIEED
nr:arabinose operon transcriptional regulator AraC [Endozoicomonas sp.]